MEEHATSISSFAFSTVNTGEPARDAKASGKEAGETRAEISEALQAVKLARGVRAEESYGQGAGPEGEGRATVHRYPAKAQADHGERSVEVAKWTWPIISFSREPYEAKVSRTGLTGGLGRRAVR